LSTAAKVATATVTTGAALVAIVSGVLNVQSRVAGDVVVPDGIVTLHDVRLEEARMPAESAGSEGADPHADFENRVAYTVKSSGGNQDLQVEYALFDAGTLQRIAGQEENTVWLTLSLYGGGEDQFNSWISVPVQPEARCIFARIYLMPLPNDSPGSIRMWRYDIADSPPFNSRTGAPCTASMSPPSR
jgi:hypothetical protein